MPTPAAMTMTVPLEVGIGCRDLATMRHFYEQVLGLQFVKNGVLNSWTDQDSR